jgi:hypothetical protein
MNWFRLWHDMPNDPKWRSIARASDRPISEVIAVFVHMMVCASAATERGRMQGWIDEDVASALDMEPDHVLAIREAMQGRVIEGNLLTGWETRQPLREDESAERTKQWRERKRTQRDGHERDVTQGDAPEERREEKIREEKSKASSPSPKNGSGAAYGSRFALESLPDEWAAFAAGLGWDRDRVERTFASFADYWRGAAGAKGRKADWQATWRNWCRRSDESPPARNVSPFPVKKNFVESVTSVIQDRAARGEKLL